MPRHAKTLELLAVAREVRTSCTKPRPVWRRDEAMNENELRVADFLPEPAT